jgi:glutamine amidotransferase-like uncharacterized protein
MDEIPPKINNFQTIVKKPDTSFSGNVAIYDGPGNGDFGVENVANNIRKVCGIEITRLSAEQIATDELSKFDILIFSGGSGSRQGLAIGEAGRKNIRAFVEKGGNYLGICAGAYLATAGFDWSLGIINARTISTVEWKRGRGFIEMEISKDGFPILGNVEGSFKCRYANGPLIQPAENNTLEAYITVANFRSEVSENDVTPGVMINTPAAACAHFGKGKVFIISPHPENTPGLENFIPRVLNWFKK